MKYLLDTNTCIFIMKKNPNVLIKLKEKQSEGVAISSVTLAELEYGVAKSTASERNRNALLAFSTIITVLPFDEKAAAEYGRIRIALEKAGTPIGSLDTMLAAHAASLNLIFVTNNTREFERVQGLVIEDWL